MAGLPRWEVVGGTDKGGIVVRAGRDLTSAQLPEKLATASLVEQVGRAGDRLHYRLLSGQGPQEGWVSIKLKDKPLLEPRAAPPPATARPEPPPVKAGEAAGDEFERRVEELRERFPGFEDPLPLDAASWAPKDLENFVESGGFVRPKAPDRPLAPPPAPPPVVAAAEGAFGVPQAVQLQDQLHAGFQEQGFQDRLLRLQRAHPLRKERGHPDGAKFVEAFEALVLTVFSRVLPKHGLQPDWDGVQDMHARMALAMLNAKVRKRQEDINTLLGLPRDAVLRPPKRAEDVFVYRPDRDGGVPGYSLPSFTDEDGDEAYEFLVEDPATGELHSSRGGGGSVPKC
mmetsp:Transcript_116836/g.371899  ORF Transcript_116836/g.371899 Transcript_116836/m.371899 type:complete len:342 (-) Transcript_116836:44-1069(-)